MGRISTSPKYVADIIGTGSALFGGVRGGDCNLEKIEKMRYL